MICSGCGAQSSATTGACSNCGKPLPRTHVATGVLTPPPDAESAATVWTPPPGVDPAATTWTPPDDAGSLTILPTINAPFGAGAETSLTPNAPRRASGVGAGPLMPGEAFGPRYHIIRLLGVGGMGAVYHAWDAELGVAVALKVIKPAVMADPRVAEEVSKRFKRELLLARQVTHKNVVRIHDLGEIDGIKYITMSYVEGFDLGTILSREGRLDARRVLQIAREVVSGLEAAHEAGVVHRDLKPENIMCENEGEALIMDFGIARSTSSSGPERRESSGVRRVREQLAANQTMVGSVIGTLEYMAPEQARGEPVDQRADIYSFGLILYDALLGRGRASTDPMAELYKRFEAPPPPVRTVHPEIPAPFDAIITKCIQPDQTKRYQTTAELVADFARLDEKGERLPLARRVTRWQLAAAAVLVVALIGASAGITRWLNPVPVEGPPPTSVLIADFENATGDSVFDGSLEQALTDAVEGASFINTYPRATAMTVATQVKPGTTRLDETMARLVSQRERVQVVLSGKIQPEGTGYRVALRAVDPIPGTTLSEATAKAGSKAQVLQAMGTAAAKIRVALGDAKSETEKLTADESFTAASLEASRDYSQAQNLAASGKNEEAIEMYKRAIAQDPRFGRAYSGWAISANLLGRTEESQQQWKKALELLDRMSERERYRTQATYFSRVMRNYEKAAETNTLLVQKYPADGMAHNNLAVAHFNLLNFEKSRDEGQKAVDLYPTNVLFRYNLALYAMYFGDYDTAEAQAKVALQANPKTTKAYLALAMARLARGDARGAQEIYAQARDTGASGASLASIGLADLSMYEGRYRDATPLLTAGITADEAAKNTTGAALKYAALAEAHLAQRNRPAALDAATHALKLSHSVSVAVPVARVLIALGKENDARALATELENQLQPVNRAYGKLIVGEIALARGRIAEAVDAFLASQQFVDYSARGGNKGYWLARYDLGVAYVMAEHYAEALSEFEACSKRQGEVAAVFVDDVPTYRYVVALPYWMGRAQEGVQQKAAAVANYKKFLALRPPNTSDPLSTDAQRRVGAN